VGTNVVRAIIGQALSKEKYPQGEYGIRICLDCYHFPYWAENLFK
jgi:hypothetical protein